MPTNRIVKAFPSMEDLCQCVMRMILSFQFQLASLFFSLALASKAASLPFILALLMYSKYLETMIAAAQAGGRMVKKHFRQSVQIAEKSMAADQQTQADLESEEAIIAFLDQIKKIHIDSLLLIMLLQVGRSVSLQCESS